MDRETKIYFATLFSVKFEQIMKILSKDSKLSMHSNFIKRMLPDQ